MRYLILSFLCLLSFRMMGQTNYMAQPSLSLVPCPVSAVPGKGSFAFSGKTTFVVENNEQAEAARTFIALFTRAAGFTPQLKVNSTRGDVVFQTDNSLASEAYRLKITPKKVIAWASDVTGFYYAIQSMRQLLPAAIETEYAAGDGKVKNVSWSMPAMTIDDYPRFGYRGLMMDVARFFTPKEDLLRIVDCMAMLKLNKLHLHLTDDNGWRIEIKRYPLLTEIGSRRVERSGKSFPERFNQRQGESTIEKGFYTQDEIREIVAYAAKRHIEVIPEIEMPAHSNAALASYPLLACPVVNRYIGVLPGIGGQNSTIIFCAGNDSVFTFLQGVLDEVMELFPSRYIHLGGDEATKTHWQECPLCQARMKQEKLATEEDLQGYFMERIARYVRDKGREPMGWDELTNTTIPQGTIIFGWRGYGEAAMKAAEQGHRFVMTPARIMYLIRYQGPQWFEPITYFGNNTLKDVYDYEPIQKDWTSHTTSLLMGVQGSLWTEFCNSVADVEYLLFPRMAALAEGAWTLPVRKNWGHFLKAMDCYNEHLEAKGIVYARSMYNIQQTVTPVNGQLQVTLDCIRPDVEVRYTTDGSLPTSKSLLYMEKILLMASQTIKAATFINGKQVGQVLELPVVWNKATAKPITGKDANGLNLLVNGVRGSSKYTDSEWCSWYKNDSIAFTLDMEKQEVVNQLTLGMITNYGMAAHKPSMIEIWISDDGKNYKKVDECTYTKEDIFKEGIYREDAVFRLEQEARFIRIIAHNAGLCPATHVRSGQETRIYFDEVIVE